MTMIQKLRLFSRFYVNQRLSRDRLIEVQNHQLQKVVQHAYETTHFYHDWLDQAGVKPEHIRCSQDLQKIPPITKDHIQKNYLSAVSDRYRPEDCLVRTTSGSSGKILRVLWEQQNFWCRIALGYRTLSMIGYSPFKKLVYFLPGSEDAGFTFGLFRHLHMPLSKPFEEVKEKLIQYKPHILSIYPSYAIDLGRHLTTQDIKRMGIRAISLNSEIILPHDVALVEDIYRCPVYQEYSSVEFGMIAAMCREKGMHIFSDNVVLEILDEAGQPCEYGEVGEVTLTALNNYAMPFIRYRIGDYSSMLEQSCPCGSSFPLLGHIEGRKDDSFQLKGGQQIPAWQIYEVVERPLEEFGMDKLILTDFYLVQKDYDLAEFYFVKGPDYQQSYIDELSCLTRRLFGPDFTLCIKEVQNIEHVKTVKRKYIHCDLPKAN